MTLSGLKPANEFPYINHTRTRADADQTSVSVPSESASNQSRVFGASTSTASFAPLTLTWVERQIDRTDVIVDVRPIVVGLHPLVPEAVGG